MRLPSAFLKPLLLSLLLGGPVPARAQDQAQLKSNPPVSLGELKRLHTGFQGNKALLFRYLDLRDLDLPVSKATVEELYALGFNDEERKELLLMASTYQRLLGGNAFDGSTSSGQALLGTLTAEDRARIVDRQALRLRYSCGVGALFANVVRVQVRLGDRVLADSRRTYSEWDGEMRSYWVTPQKLLCAERAAHFVDNGMDLTEAFTRLGVLKKAEPKPQATGFSAFLNKAETFLDVQDSFIGPAFPVVQLYVPKGLEFSVRFRSDKPLTGRAIYLIPLKERDAEGLSPAFGWRTGKKKLAPDVTHLNPPYEASYAQSPDWVGMYGAVGNYPNGIREGHFLAVLAPAGRPLEAEQAFVLQSGGQEPPAFLSRVAWW